MVLIIFFLISQMDDQVSRLHLTHRCCIQIMAERAS